MYCARCGSPLRDGSRYCGRCGYAVRVPSPHSEPRINLQPTPPARVAMRHPAVGVAVAFVILVTSVFVVSYGLATLFFGGSREGATQSEGGEYDTSSSSSTSAKGIHDVEAKTLDGVDISGWQEDINIYTTDADFFIIKASEGLTRGDKLATRFNANYKLWANQALCTGRLVGFYHYANGGNPEDEADEFYEAIKDYKGVCIACLDWEELGNLAFRTGKDVGWCKAFLDRFASRFGCIPFIYMNKSHTNAYDWSSVSSRYPLWGAQYANYKEVWGYQSEPWQSKDAWGSWGKSPRMFQYTSSGVLLNCGGIKHFDLDLFYGNESDWYTYARGTVGKRVG